MNRDKVMAILEKACSEAWEQYCNVPIDHPEKKYVSGKWVATRTLYFDLKYGDTK